MEWWDCPLVGLEYSVKSGVVTDVDGAVVDVVAAHQRAPLKTMVTSTVQHPVPIAPSAEEAPPPPMPLMLTCKERDKIRRRAKQEAQEATRE
jgi:hypothetical protein